jgi:hypothetical protein
VVSIAAKIGCTPQTLNEWVKKAEVDSGHKPGLTSDMAAKMKALEREKRELRQANAHDFLREGEVVLTFDDGPWPKNTQMHRPRTGGAASTWLGRQDSIRLKKPCFRGITAQKERMCSPVSQPLQWGGRTIEIAHETRCFRRNNLPTTDAGFSHPSWAETDFLFLWVCFRFPWPPKPKC